MGQVSRQLQHRLRAVGRSTTRVQVVVRLHAPPQGTVPTRPLTERERNLARDILSSAGVPDEVLLSQAFAPRRIVQGVPRVALQVAPADVPVLAAAGAVDYVRLERMHRLHLNQSVPMLGIDAGVRANVTGRGIKVAVIDSGIDASHPDFGGRARFGRNFSGEGDPGDFSDTIGHGTHVAGIIGGGGATYKGVAPEVELIACKVFAADGRAPEGAVQAAVEWARDEIKVDIINYSGGYSPVEFHPTVGPIALVEPPWVLPEAPLAEEAEFKEAMDKGVVCVVSAGNDGLIGRDGTLSVPATSRAVISVGAVETRDELGRFSSWGPVYRSERVPHEDPFMTLTKGLHDESSQSDEPDLVAPGGQVIVAGVRGGVLFPGIISTLSSAADQVDRTALVLPWYQRICGTSQAAPHVAGLAALILQRANDMGINLGPKSGGPSGGSSPSGGSPSADAPSDRAYAVKRILRDGAVPLPDYGRSGQGYGLPQWAKIEQALRDLQDARR